MGVLVTSVFDSQKCTLVQPLDFKLSVQSFESHPGIRFLFSPFRMCGPRPKLTKDEHYKDENKFGGQ